MTEGGSGCATRGYCPPTFYTASNNVPADRRRTCFIPEGNVGIMPVLTVRALEELEKFSYRMGRRFHLRKAGPAGSPWIIPSFLSVW